MRISSNRNRSKSANRGIAVVEFAIVATFFFSLFFSLVDFCIYSHVKLTMQHAVREGARYAITGQSVLNEEGVLDRNFAILEKIEAASNGYLNKVTDDLDDDIRVVDINGAEVTGFGSAGEIIVINIDCTWPSSSPIMYSFLEGGNYKFTVSAAMQNEAF